MSSNENTQQVNGISPDAPLKNPEDDKLSRDDFSRSIAERIAGYKGEDSLVIGLNGAWGSGKTTVINFIKDYLNNKTDNKKPTVIDFNPWLYTDVTNITGKFLSELAIKLGVDEDNKMIAYNLENYGYKIGAINRKVDFLSKSSSSDFIPFLSLIPLLVTQFVDDLKNYKWYSLIVAIFFLIPKISHGIGDFLDKKLKVAKAKSATERTSSLYYKEEVKNALKKYDKNILIIIDDIDRLHTNEMLNVFKLVKMVADFPNVIYLMAFDFDVVENHLSQQSSIVNRGYLEKIIQLKLNLPTANEEELEYITMESIKGVLHRTNTNALDYYEDEFIQVFFEIGLSSILNDLRKVRRLIYSYEFYLSLFVNIEIIEVNPVDFFVLESLRLYCREVYDFIWENKFLFLKDSAYLTPNIEEKWAEINEVIKNYEVKNNYKINKILRLLLNNNNVDVDTLVSSKYLISHTLNRKGMRINLSYYFYKYFNFTHEGFDGNITQNYINEFTKIDNNEDLVDYFEFIDEAFTIEAFLKQIYYNNKLELNNDKIKMIGFAIIKTISQKESYIIKSSSSAFVEKSYYSRYFLKELLEPLDNKFLYSNWMYFISNCESPLLIIRLMYLDTLNKKLSQKQINEMYSLIDSKLMELKNEILNDSVGLFYILKEWSHIPNTTYVEFRTEIINDSIKLNYLIGQLLETYEIGISPEEIKFLTKNNLTFLERFGYELFDLPKLKEKVMEYGEQGDENFKEYQTYLEEIDKAIVYGEKQTNTEN